MENERTASLYTPPLFLNSPFVQSALLLSLQESDERQPEEKRTEKNQCSSNNAARWLLMMFSNQCTHPPLGSSSFFNAKEEEKYATAIAHIAAGHYHSRFQKLCVRLWSRYAPQKIGIPARNGGHSGCISIGKVQSLVQGWPDDLMNRINRTYPIAHPFNLHAL